MNHQDHKQIRRILINVNRTDGIYYRFAKRSRLKENTLALFYALSDGEPHSQKEICDEWMIPRTTINTIVHECVEGGYIQLEKSTRMKEKVLFLTESGKKLAHEWIDDLFAAEQEAFAKTRSQYGDEFVYALSFFVNELEKQLLHDEL